jgi:hypothetical protein
MAGFEHLGEGVGYELHTNRELGLMLRGSKPLAFFAEPYGRFGEVLFRYFRMFDRHVARGALVKREYLELADTSLFVHVVLYATPSEEWRIDAMIQLRLQWEGPWTDEHERTEGSLLGYTDRQNDIWINRRR